MPTCSILMSSSERLERLNQAGRAVSYEELRSLLYQFHASAGALTLRDIVACRSIAARQRGLIELSDGLSEEEQQQKCAEWLSVEQVFDEQMAGVLPPDENTTIDGLLTRQANLEQARHVVKAATEKQKDTSAFKRPRGSLLGWTLVVAGVVSLLFGWPWGSLVGAILVLAGVVALKNQPEKLTPEEEFRAGAHRLVDSFDVDAWVIKSSP